MQRLIRGVCLVLVLAAGSGGVAQAQHALTWDEVKARFENNNPTLRAGKLGVDESRAQETTAYLRPNPNLALTVDQINPFDGGPPHSTFGSLLMVAAASYLHERQHKRELRWRARRGRPRLRKTRRRIWNARCCSHYVWRLCRRCRERRFWRSQRKI